MQSKEWRNKYSRLRNVFDRAEEKYIAQTHEHIKLQQIHKKTLGRLERLKNQRDSFRDLCDNKIEENERLFHKLQKIERRVTGVPDGNYLLKKHKKLLKKIKKIKQHKNTDSKDHPANSLLADDISTIVHEKCKLEDDCEKMEKQLQDKNRLYNQIKQTADKCWKDNEVLRSMQECQKTQKSLLEEEINRLNDEIYNYKTEIRILNQKSPGSGDAEQQIEILTKQNNDINTKYLELLSENKNTKERLNCALNEIIEQRNQIKVLLNRNDELCDENIVLKSPERCIASHSSSTEGSGDDNQLLDEKSHIFQVDDSDDYNKNKILTDRLLQNFESTNKVNTKTTSNIHKLFDDPINRQADEMVHILECKLKNELGKCLRDKM